jgi:Flp pilus assembly protein TadB
MNRVCEVKATAHVPVAKSVRGGVVPLSDHEQRQLEQIEQALYREDPKFGRVVRSSDPRVHYKRKLVQALVGALIGAGLVAAGVVTHHHLYLEVAGAVVLVMSLLWAVINWRQHTARTRTARAKAKGRPDRRRPAAGGRTSLMERLEERWRRRQEGDRRM